LPSIDANGLQRPIDSRIIGAELELSPMRARAIAIAQAEQKARESRLLLAAGLLLLPALLLLLLISP
jgi:uncharacterized membrane protein YqjE